MHCWPPHPASGRQSISSSSGNSSSRSTRAGVQTQSRRTCHLLPVIVVIGARHPPPPLHTCTHVECAHMWHVRAFVMRLSSNGKLAAQQPPQRNCPTPATSTRCSAPPAVNHRTTHTPSNAPGSSAWILTVPHLGPAAACCSSAAWSPSSSSASALAGCLRLPPAAAFLPPPAAAFLPPCGRWQGWCESRMWRLRRTGSGLVDHAAAAGDSRHATR